MEKKMTNKIRINYNGLDIGKFLCALLILLYHYFSEHGPIPEILDEALSLYAVAVALFMAISGFLTFDKLEHIREKEKRWRYVKKQVRRILTMYLLWSIPYLIFSISKWDWNHIQVSFVFWQIQGWIFKSTFYTIWFMPSLAIGLVLSFWITEKLPMWVTAILAVSMYTVGSMMLTYLFVGEMIPGYEKFAVFASTWLGGPRGWLFFAFPLLVLGKTMVTTKKKIKAFPAAVLSVVFVLCMLIEALILRKIAGHTGIDMTIFMGPTVFCILGFLINIKLPNGRYTIWMRNMSTLIFMSQRLFLTVFPYYLTESTKRLLFNENYGWLVICSVTILFSTFIWLLSKKFDWMKKLY